MHRLWASCAKVREEGFQEVPRLSGELVLLSMGTDAARCETLFEEPDRTGVEALLAAVHLASPH